MQPRPGQTIEPRRHIGFNPGADHESLGQLRALIGSTFSDIGTAVEGDGLTARDDSRQDNRMHKMLRRLCVLSALCGLTLSHSLGAETSNQPIALKAARLFDGKSKTLLPHGVVLIQGNKITAAGSNLTVPNDAKVIDLGDSTLAPGFIDAHTHLTTDFYSQPYDKLRLKDLDETPPEMALESVPHARATLEAGFT
ncbi:MAG TPA: hypothetical protein VHW03_09155, partial [Chthoniobacterales bacterium]|nr:hypothetical protein [Chthoniobacterales bacterium]